MTIAKLTPKMKAHAIERLASLACGSITDPVTVYFVAIGKPVRGGTHQRIKAFVCGDRSDMTNITGYLCSALDLNLDTSDLSTVVHRDTIILDNLAMIPGLESYKGAKISWQ